MGYVNAPSVAMSTSSIAIAGTGRSITKPTMCLSTTPLTPPFFSMDLDQRAMAWPSALFKRDHCTALLAVQDPSMTPTSLLGVWGGAISFMDHLPWPGAGCH